MLAFPVALKAGDEGRNRIVQPDPALIDEDHHARGCRDDFRQRREVEDRVQRHGLRRRNNSALADRFVIHRAIGEAYEHDRARQFPVGDGLLDQRLNRVEP